MKLFVKIVLCVFLVFVLAGGGGMAYLSKGLKAGSQLVINNIDLSTLSDGMYTGTYKAGRWTNEVSVEVKDHQIAQITLLKDVVFSKPDITDQLLQTVVKAQTLNVDVITGSTVTCKAYLKAIENALHR